MWTRPEGVSYRVTTAGAYRMVWIKVDTERTGCDLIASIGHELRHATEILIESDLRSTHEMHFFYTRTGLRGPGRGGFETTAARDAGIAVRSEVRACGPSTSN